MDKLPQSSQLTNPKKKVEDKYHQKRVKVLSPDRKDPLEFMYEKGLEEKEENEDDTYKGRMLRQQLENEHLELNRKIAQQRDHQFKKLEEGKRALHSHQTNNQQSTTQSEWEHIDRLEKHLKQDNNTHFSHVQPQQQQQQQQQQQSSSRLQMSQQNQMTPGSGSLQRKSRWDQTPLANYDATPGRQHLMETPTPGRLNQSDHLGGATPTPRRIGKSKWDKTPLNITQQTPNQLQGYTPTPGQMLTPNTQAIIGLQGMTNEQIKSLQLQKEIEERNQYMTDEQLDSILPSKGYEVVAQPEGYKPQREGQRQRQNLLNQSTLSTPQSYYNVPESARTYLNQMINNVQQTPLSMQSNALPNIKPEDVGYFGALLNEVRDEELSLSEQKERKIMMLLLKIKNGTPPMRKSALRQITINARDFGAGPLFNQILPLLMSPTLDEQERHLLVKVIDRILYKLDDMVRPYVHKILVVIEPLLIDEDYYARVEGREIISNLSKAAGLATMISTMRPDIDHQDEYVRNTTARAFAVVASALGVPALLPFLKAVCNSKKSWQARHTGIKIIQQVAILMGCAVLPHLKHMVDIISGGLKDQQQKVKTITSLGLAALAEASTPYGIEAFYQVLIPLWHGIKQQRGKSLAAYLKAIGFIIPLMENQQASDYTKMIMPILKREFQNNEEEMKKIILKVLKQCLSSDGIKPQYIRENIVQEFFRNYWIRRNALDKRNYKQLVETTVEIARKTGGGEIIQLMVDDLKDESEQYRKMVMETIEKIVLEMGVSDMGNRLEIQLMDGILHCFQEQSEDNNSNTHHPPHNVMLNAFGAVILALGQRAKPYFSQICGIIQWRLNNKSNKVRQQAADLICRVAGCMKECNEEARLGRLGVLLYECLGEEYPEVLGSLLAALKAIVNVIGMTKMTPPIKDLLPRLTPILKNRHEKVQENTIDLVGRIADRGSEYVSPKEWIRICFDLLDLLKAHKKGIRRATVNTFGFIAKAIGPQDVLVTLLNNLKVQERQNRVCTTVAIAIICETCGPYTVLPGLMNEYRVQELNVQNGVLKSLSFMFEYVGEMGKDYIYAITPLLEDALTDRDLVHRQTAASAVKHLALGVQGLGCEDALVHLLNFIWPNIFETSPHVVNAINEAVEGLRVSLGAGIIQQYILQGLFHPAKRVRVVYWKFYNMLYVNSQEQMLPYFPQLNLLKDPLQDTSIYLRNELYNLI